MNAVIRAVIVGSLSLLMILSGVWLSRLGRPLNVGISTLHKLLGLGVGVYFLVTALQRNRMAPLTTGEWIAVVVTGLFFVAMAATGGLLASDKPVPVAVLRIHQILPALTVASTGVTLFLLLGQ